MKLKQESLVRFKDHFPLMLKAGIMFFMQSNVELEGYEQKLLLVLNVKDPLSFVGELMMIFRLLFSGLIIVYSLFLLLINPILLVCSVMKLLGCKKWAY
jgi:hypothetical protein